MEGEVPVKAPLFFFYIQNRDGSAALSVRCGAIRLSVVFVS